MKRNCLFFVLLYCGLLTNSTAQTYIKNWDKTFGGNSRDWNSQIIKSNSGSLFLIGDSQTNTDGDKNVPLCNQGIENADIWLIKIDTSGTIILQKDIGGDGDERFPQLIAMNNSNGQLLFSCTSVSDSSCNKTEDNRDTIPIYSSDYWICLLDSNGNIIWDKTLGGDNYDDYTQIQILSNGNILVSGESNSPISGDKTISNYSVSNDLWTVILDSSGNILNNFVYGGTGAEFLSGVIACPGGEYLLAGTTSSDAGGDVSQPSQGGLDYWMIKIDNAGNKLWDKRFGGSGGEKCSHVSTTEDNGYIMCGYTVSPADGDVTEQPKGLQDFWVVKTDSSGNKIWDKRFGGDNGSIATWIEKAENGGFWVAGYSDCNISNDVTESSYGESDYWIIKLDSSGNKLWDKRFGGSQNEFSSSFVILPDSSLYLFGYSDSGSSAVKTATSKGWLDYWLVKFNYNSGTVGLEEIFSNNIDLSIFPNPSPGITGITIQSQLATLAEITVLDYTGRKVFTQNIKVERGENKLKLNLSGFSKGSYIILYRDNSGSTFRSKLILN